FAKPHRTLTIEDESPLPGGLANGVWKARPVTTLARWGIALARMRPPANQARWWSQNIVKYSGAVHLGQSANFNPHRQSAHRVDHMLRVETAAMKRSQLSSRGGRAAP